MSEPSSTDNLPFTASTNGNFQDETAVAAAASQLLYGLEDNPPTGEKFLAALQHLLAIFVSIITAPLIISTGMGLGPTETSYMISSSLFMSGIATLIQVKTFGPLGSGLLSIQGTSFSFIGPLIFAAGMLEGTRSNDELLAVIFGSTAAGAVVVMILSQFLQKLQNVITPVVAGATVIVLGITLVQKTAANLINEYHRAETAGESTFFILALAFGVIALILWFSSRKTSWCRLSSISIGLTIGYLVAIAFGQIDFSLIADLPVLFYPQPFKYGLGFDWGIFLSMLPIYLVTATESVGDLTATSSLSNLPIKGDSYWRRLRNGVLGDGFNSWLAAVFNTFPNTTFSQNNGVIQLTGVASRHVGIVIAGMLVVMATFPIIGGLFQVMPKGLLYGSTGLMFALVGWAGVRIVIVSGGKNREWFIIGAAIVVGFALSFLPRYIPDLPPVAVMLLAFPVAAGTTTAMILELLLPKALLAEAPND